MIAQPTNTYKLPTHFGIVMMADDSWIETTNPQSKLVGRAQGLYRSTVPIRKMPIIGDNGVFLLDGEYAIA
ncbi:hypothetical protein WN944_029415 [Citrus x changshan-huyou]|uniref:Dirigent protein n=1 Tax=Citrus x changshan-huyou TaxID=2935761 RepID=A0AAP0QB28_9ROSI